MPADNVRNFAAAPEQRSRKCLCVQRFDGGGAGGGPISVRRQSQLLRGARQQPVGQNPDRDSHDKADDRCRQRKSQHADRRYPQRREDHAADAAAVVGHRKRGRPRAHEPGRHDGVECGRAHGAPAKAGEQRCGEQLPRRNRERPARHTHRQRQCAGLRHHGKAKPPMDRRQVGTGNGADQEVHRDRGRHQRQRPSSRALDDAEEHGRAVEADAPAEHRHDERSAHDAPAVEYAACSRSLPSGRATDAGRCSGSSWPCFGKGRRMSAGLTGALQCARRRAARPDLLLAGFRFGELAAPVLHHGCVGSALRLTQPTGRRAYPRGVRAVPCLRVAARDGAQVSSTQRGSDRRLEGWPSCWRARDPGGPL